MSHELEMNEDGTANMVWANTPCWHGLGTELSPDASAIEWMKAANLDWTVSRQPMFTTLPNGEHAAVSGKGENANDYGVLVRDRKGEYDVFGPVGPDWVPVQNSEVFDFMDKFCQAGSMKMETCGALKGGTEIWALARFADDFEVVKGDQVKGYFLFRSCHVWGKGNIVKVTPVRVVCNNTMTLALGQGNNHFKMPHIKAMDAEVQEAAVNALGIGTETIASFKEQSQFLASKAATDAQVDEFIARIYAPKALLDTSDATLRDLFTPSASNVLEAIDMAPGADLKGSRGTWWGALNGVTYHEDHMRISFQDQSNILGSTLFGGGARKKEKAMALAMEYANA